MERDWLPLVEADKEALLPIRESTHLQILEPVGWLAVHPETGGQSPPPMMERNSLQLVGGVGFIFLKYKSSFKVVVETTAKSFREGTRIQCPFPVVPENAKQLILNRSLYFLATA